MRIVIAAAAVLVVTFVFAQRGYCQVPRDLTTLAEEIKALKAGQAAIQKDAFVWYGAVLHRVAFSFTTKSAAFHYLILPATAYRAEH